jgi:excinuclease UvrABC nuclease subunit
MALLLECTEIKDLWPVYNKALKRFEPKYGLFEYEARNGYRYLAIGKLTKNQSCIPFDTIYDGINLLQELAKQFEIDQSFLNMEAFQMAKLHYKLTTKIYQIVTIIMIRFKQQSILFKQ